MRNLFPATHAGKQRDVQLAQQTVQNLALRLQVETFHVHQASVACRHQHRNPSGAGALPQDGLDVQRIGLLDEAVRFVRRSPAVC